MKRKLCVQAALLAALILLAASAVGEGLLGVTVSYTPAPTAQPSLVPATAAPTATPFSPITQKEIEDAALGERILMRGMAGVDVELVQKRLYALGYYLEEIDGVYGLNTRSAVIAFQRAHKLQKIDGKVGPETISRMFAADAIVKPTPTPTPTPTPKPTPTPTATPDPTPVPTATPDVQSAPFALESVEVYVADMPVTLTIGKDEAGERLYPLCGVLSHMGFDYTYAAGSWQLTRMRDDAQIALMTAGLKGLNPGSMGSYNGLIFLTDDAARVYVYDEEAYVTEALLEQLGVSVIVVGETPVIH